jgi:hypothetical protein
MALPPHARAALSRTLGSFWQTVTGSKTPEWVPYAFGTAAVAPILAHELSKRKAERDLQKLELAKAGSIKTASEFQRLQDLDTLRGVMRSSLERARNKTV